MKRIGGGFLLGANALWLFTSAAVADIKDNPYDLIVDRNAFGLRAPMPEMTNVPVPPPPAPLATVKLTGITTMFSKTRALVEIIPAPGKPPVKPILEVGDRVETVEVLAIDAEKNTVKIRNGTVETNLTFEIAKAPAGPVPGAPGMPVPHPAIPMPTPTASAPTTPATTWNVGSGRGGVMVGGATATPTTAVPPATATPVMPGNYGVNTGTLPPATTYAPGGTYRQIPSRQVRTTPITSAPTPTAPTVSGKTMTPEEQAIYIEALRMKMGSSGPPLPPTALTPLIQGQ